MSVYCFTAAFSSAHADHFIHHKITSNVLLDIAWWQNQLLLPWCGLHLKKPPEPSSSRIYVDTLTSWGVGLIIDGKWQAWWLIPGWKFEGRDIGWAEMVAIEPATRTVIAMGICSSHFIFNFDNMGVGSGLSAGRSCNTHQNASLQRIVSLFTLHNIFLTMSYVPTLSNPADGLSHGVFPSNSLHLGSRWVTPSRLLRSIF